MKILVNDDQLNRTVKFACQWNIPFHFILKPVKNIWITQWLAYLAWAIVAIAC